MLQKFNYITELELLYLAWHSLMEKLEKERDFFQTYKTSLSLKRLEKYEKQEREIHLAIINLESEEQ